MATIKTDLICNLNQPVNVTYLHGNLFSQDNAGNTINVFVMDNGEPATIGGTVSANVIRSDGQTVAVSGSIEGNKAYVILPQACYAVPGVVHIIIKLTQNTTVTTIAAIVANVYMSTTDSVIDPGQVIPSIQALMALIEEAVDSIPTDYTGLLHTIAADYSSSKTYNVGDYAWQSGVLKRCIVPITAAETYTAAHWTNAVIGDDLSNLKSAFDSVNEFSLITPNAVVENYALTTNGYAVSNDSFRVLKYQVAPGEKVWIKCETPWNGKSSFQFQNSPDASSSSIAQVIGTPSTSANDNYVTVPDGASWLLMAVLKTDTHCGVYSNTIKEIENELNYIKDDRFYFDKPVTWQNGYINTNGKVVSSSLSGYALITLNAGETIIVGTANSNISLFSITNAETVSVGDTVLPVEKTSSSAWTEYTYFAEHDTKCVVCVLKSNYILKFYRSLANVESQLLNIEGYTGTRNLIGNIPGVHYPLKAVKGDVFTASNGTGNNFNSNTVIHFYDANKNETTYFGIGGNIKRTVSYTSNTPAEYVSITQDDMALQQIMLVKGAASASYTPYISNSITENLPNRTVLITEQNKDVFDKINYAIKLKYGQTVQPAVFLHFSDIHGSQENLLRLIEMRNSLSLLIDDTICTGDMVSNKYTDGFDWWGVDGAEKILLTIGNHDVTDGVDYNNYGGTTPEGAYNTFFAPYIANWNVTHTGTLTYYYKDYADKKLRLVALDYLLTGNDATDQNTWLQNILSDANTNDYTVVIIQHCPVSNETLINSDFTMIDKVSSQTYPVMYQQSVQNFINNGGKFACYLTGHTHWDMLCYNANFPDQLCVTVSCAITTGRDGDQHRGKNTKSQDAANVVVIDTTTTTVKLIRIGADMDYYLRPRNVMAINYLTKSIIST